MPRKKTDAEFKKQVYELVKDEYTVTGTYIGANSKVEFTHNTCGNVFMMVASNFLNGRRCPAERYAKIASKTRLSPSEFESRVESAYGKGAYIVNTNYSSFNNPVSITHTECGRTFNISPASFLRERDAGMGPAGCPICSRERAFKKETKTQEQFNKEVEREGEGNYTVLGDYVRWDVPILIRHDICGYEYHVQPNSFLQGRRCPNCGRSNGERVLRDYLKSRGIKFEYPKTFPDLKDSRRLHYDFWLPEYNMLIEYQGGQHYRSREYFGGVEKFKKQQKHDAMKRQYAKDNEYKLVELDGRDNNSKVKIYKNMDNILGVTGGTPDQEQGSRFSPY